MDRETFDRLRRGEIKATPAHIKELHNDLRDKKEEFKKLNIGLEESRKKLNDLKILNSLNGGINPLDDPEIKDDWANFSEAEKTAAKAVAEQLQKILDAGGDPHEAMRGIVQQLQIADNAIKDRFRVYRQALDQGLPTNLSEVVQDGGNYKVKTTVNAGRMEVGDARICFLPVPMPDSWEPDSYIHTGKPLPSEWAALQEIDFLGLPFEKVWIESKSPKGITNVIITSPNLPDNEMVFVGCLLSTEVVDGSPRLMVQAVTVANLIKDGRKVETRITTVKYGITNHLIHWMNLVMMSQGNESGKNLTLPDDSSGIAYGLMCPSFYTVIGFMLSLRNKEVRMGSERVNERIKVGSGKDKRLVKIKQVVHVALHRKDSVLPKTTPQGREIDWSHRWEVMGHWRKVGGIGKDPTGLYGIKGFTWVTPHERGPENKPVVKKVRVIEQ